MKCANCSSSMLEVEVIHSTKSEQIRYQCPVCGGVHLTTRQTGSHRITTQATVTQPYVSN